MNLESRYLSLPFLNDIYGSCLPDSSLYLSNIHSQSTADFNIIFSFAMRSIYWESPRGDLHVCVENIKGPILFHSLFFKEKAYESDNGG